MSHLESFRRAQARIRAEREFRTKGEEGGKGAHRVDEALPFLSMTLDEFGVRGACLEVRVHWLPVTLWMVPSDQDAERLVRDGISRGRIWTATELVNLMSTPDRTRNALMTV